MACRNRCDSLALAIFQATKPISLSFVLFVHPKTYLFVLCAHTSTQSVSLHLLITIIPYHMIEEWIHRILNEKTYLSLWPFTSGTPNAASNLVLPAHSGSLLIRRVINLRALRWGSTGWGITLQSSCADALKNKPVCCISIIHLSNHFGATFRHPPAPANPIYLLLNRTVAKQEAGVVSHWSVPEFSHFLPSLSRCPHYIPLVFYCLVMLYSL